MIDAADGNVESSETGTNVSDTDAVSKETRTKLYISGVGAGFGITVIAGILGIWVPDIREQVAATATVLNGGLLTALGALGVAYRPTKH